MRQIFLATSYIIQQFLCIFNSNACFSLKFDNLQHPGADLGMKMPCMLSYKYHKNKEVIINFRDDLY